MYRLIIDLLERIAARRGARHLLPQGMRRTIAQFVHDRENYRSVGRALAGRKANLDTIEKFLLTQPTRLSAPLALISQAQRSGGTLLSQLLEGHPALAAHPHELAVGHPTDEVWPVLDPALGVDKNFRMLFDIGTLGLIRMGYTKGNRDSKRRRFFLVPRLQHRLFRHLFEMSPPANAREVLDHFFTSYFNAWLNYQGNLANKRWITAFAPRLANHAASVSGFFEAYPDGRLIQVIRDPRSWYPSAKHHGKSGLVGKAPEEILATWCVSAESMLRNKSAYGEKVIVLRFEDLVENTEATMRLLAHELGIDYHSILTVPTFNGEPMRANSSFAVETSGIIDAPLKRANTLTEEERKLIEQRCLPLYQSATAAVSRIAA